MSLNTRIRATALLLLTTLVLFACLYTPVLALLTDRQRASAAGQAGTLQLSEANLRFVTADPSASDGNQMTLWQPGDVNTLQWEIDNQGTKSVDLRYTVNIYWNEGSGMTPRDDEPASSALWAEAPYVLLYPATMSDAEVTADLETGAPTQYLALGDSDALLSNDAGAVRYGYSYTFDGATLDGVGSSADAEVGDATTPGATSDAQELKFAMTLTTPVGFMDRDLVFELVVEGKQHRNTNGSDWHVIETQIIQ